MPITIHEKFDSRLVTMGNDPSAELRYVVRGTNDDYSARVTVQAGSPIAFDVYNDGTLVLWRESISLEPVGDDSQGQGLHLGACLVRGHAIRHDSREFEDLVVRSEGGTLVRLRDVAEIELGAESYDSTSWYKGKTAVFMGIEQAPGANPLTVAASVKAGAYEPLSHEFWKTGAAEGVAVPPDPLRWHPIAIPDEPTDFIDGLRTVAVNGDADAQTGIAVHLVLANRSMQRAFVNADGEMLLVPQQGALTLTTELGVLQVAPGAAQGGAAQGGQVHPLQDDAAGGGGEEGSSRSPPWPDIAAARFHRFDQVVYNSGC